MTKSDPWTPDIEEHSADLKIPVDVIVSKYPSFDHLRPSEKLDLFTDIQAENPTKPIELVLREANINETMYKDIVDDPDYMTILHSKCIARRLGPRLAKIYEKLADAAENGDPAMIKTVLSTGANLSPDSVAYVNHNLINMSNPELIKQIESVKEGLERLNKND